MFEEFNAPLPDSQAYLKRLGLQFVGAPDLETLDRLIKAHQHTVPFENLDVYDAGAEVSLETEALYDKIVNRRRGGYCFELNCLFMSLLKSLGYECYPVAARVVWMSTGYMPITHRAGIVLLDGKRYFCDVGFGGPSPNRALLLDETEPQVSGAHSFVFTRDPDGDYVINKKTDNGLERLLKFSDRPCENVDFLAPNEYQSQNRRSGFKMMRIINISREDGSAAINNNVLRIHKDGTVEEQLLDTEEKLKKALGELFGIHVDFPLKACEASPLQK